MSCKLTFGAQCCGLSFFQCLLIELIKNILLILCKARCEQGNTVTQTFCCVWRMSDILVNIYFCEYLISILSLDGHKLFCRQISENKKLPNIFWVTVSDGCFDYLR